MCVISSPHETSTPESGILHDLHTDRPHRIVSRWDRLLVFGGFNLAALACFILCFVLWPILFPTPRKFAIL